jgi:hypothetical protein
MRDERQTLLFRHISLLSPSHDTPLSCVSCVGDERVRARDLRLCIALGTGEPGYGAKGQDEEEADQKTPPARLLLVSSPSIRVV